MKNREPAPPLQAEGFDIDSIRKEKKAQSPIEVAIFSVLSQVNGLWTGYDKSPTSLTQVLKRNEDRIFREILQWELPELPANSVDYAVLFQKEISKNVFRVLASSAFGPIPPIQEEKGETLYRQPFFQSYFLSPDNKNCIFNDKMQTKQFSAFLERDITDCLVEGDWFRSFENIVSTEPSINEWIRFCPLKINDIYVSLKKFLEFTTMEKTVMIIGENSVTAALLHLIEDRWMALNPLASKKPFFDISEASIENKNTKKEETTRLSILKIPLLRQAMQKLEPEASGLLGEAKDFLKINTKSA